MAGQTWLTRQGRPNVAGQTWPAKHVWLTTGGLHDSTTYTGAGTDGRARHRRGLVRGWLRVRADRHAVERGNLRAHPPHRCVAHRRGAGRAAVLPQGPGDRRVAWRGRRHGAQHRRRAECEAGLRGIDLRQLRPRPAIEQDRPCVRAEPDTAARAGHRFHPAILPASVRLRCAQKNSRQRHGRI
jgi:hypothetical protein